MTFRVRSALPASLIVLASFVGCGGGENLKNVTGTVTMDGKPLQDALVTFSPVEGGRPAAARTNESGEYELIFTRSSEGAKPGEYVVRISTAKETFDENDVAQVVPETVPVQYNFDTELKATVTEGGPNVFPFELKSEGEIRQPESNT